MGRMLQMRLQNGTSAEDYDHTICSLIAKLISVLGLNVCLLVSASLFKSQSATTSVASDLCLPLAKEEFLAQSYSNNCVRYEPESAMCPIDSAPGWSVDR